MLNSRIKLIAYLPPFDSSVHIYGHLSNYGFAVNMLIKAIFKLGIQNLNPIYCHRILIGTAIGTTLIIRKSNFFPEQQFIIEKLIK